MIYLSLCIVIVGLATYGVLIFRNKPKSQEVDISIPKNRKTDELPPGIKFRKTYHIKTQYSSFSNRSGAVTGSSSKEPKNTTHVSYPGVIALNQYREEDNRLHPHRHNDDNLGVMLAMSSIFAASSSVSNEEHSNSQHENSCNDDSGSSQQNNNIDSSGSDM